MTKLIQYPLICVILAYTAFPAVAGTLGTPQENESIVGQPGAKEAKCSQALHYCMELNTAYDAQAQQLKQDNQKLADALVQASRPPLLPTWAWATIGVLTGAIIGAKVLK